MTDINWLLSVAHRAVDLADRHFHDRPSTVSMKSDRDMVTEVDLAIEKQIREYLAEQTPTIGFLGEENGRQGATGELMWASIQSTVRRTSFMACRCSPSHLA